MKYNLLVPNHVIDSYRKRVYEDVSRNQRSDEEIKIMIEQAFLHSQHPKHFKENTHLVVYFRDLFSGQIFHPLYYLVINFDKEQESNGVLKGRNLITKTIKYPLEVLLNRKIDYLKKRDKFN